MSTDTLAGSRVVLIDDSREDLALMAFHLRRAGVTPVEALDGETGRRIVGTRTTAVPVDAIICDLDMPGADGIETTEAIRRDGYDGPIIAVSGAATDEDLRRWMVSGCDTFVAKPLEPVEFIATVVEACRRAALRNR